MSTALVTGATGFIGHHLCRELYAKGHEVIAIGTKGENHPICSKFYQLDLDGVPWNLLPNIDICFHQAANNDTTDMDMDNMLRSNVTAPSNLFYRLVKEKKCKQFVYASSCSVYGNQPVPYVERKTKTEPLNPYAKSKLLFEQFAENFSVEQNVNTVGLRYSNVYGPGENHKGKRASMITQLLQIMLKEERPKIFKFGEQLRDWVYIQDVVNANILASQYHYSNVFNVGAGEAASFNLLIDLINNELCTKLEPEYIDCPFLYAYQANTQLDLNHSKSCLKYEPKYTVVNGIKKLVEEIKKATT